MSRAWLVLAVLLLPSCATTVARRAEEGAVPRARDDLATWVAAAVAEAMEADRIPGAAVVLVRDGRVVLEKGYGLADVAEGRPVTSDGTAFRIGSISKLLTLLALARLVDRGAVELETPVADLLGGAAPAGRPGNPVRVRHLLSHSGGFDQVGLRRQVDDPAERLSIREFVERELVPVRPPGAVGVYDTYGVMLAARIVERVGGFPYAEHMRRHVFEPLGMRRTFVEARTAEPGALATGYGLEGDELVPQGYEWYVTTPASSVDSTAYDMGRLLVALLVDGGGVVGPAMAERIRSERLLAYGEMGAFSWGFWEERRGGYRALHHGGTMAGYTSELYLVPEAGTGFFVAYNRDAETGPPARLREALTDLLFERVLPAREPGTPDPDPGRDPRPIDTARFAGAYGGTVACFTCEEGRGWPISSFRVEAAGPGLLALYGGAARFRAVGDTVFVGEESGREIRFLEDELGRVRYLVRGPDSFAKLDEVLLDEVLGPGWRDRPPTSLVAVVHRANEAWPEAARAYASLSARHSDNGRFAFYEGYSELHDGRYDAARAAFRRALELGQWTAWSRYYLAAAYAAEGDADRASEELAAAIDLGFEDAGLLDTDPWWDGLGSAPALRSARERLGG